MTTTQKHRKHPERCTTGTLFTKEQAYAKLAEMGYTFDTERFEWVDAAGQVGGRLVWSPDFCNPDDCTTGTSFWLRSPAGVITPLELS